MKNWQLRIFDPSGEVRLVPIKGTVILGRSDASMVLLRDPSLPKEAAKLVYCADEESKKNTFPYWIQVLENCPTVWLGDLPVKDAQVPPELSIRIGETKIILQSVQSSISLPVQPASVRHWYTRTQSGQEVLWIAKKAATTALSIYIAGETGVGKEVLSGLIHAWSERASGPFVPLHCGALPINLAESELFGHVKGAFTGASHHRSGALMQAHGGTLFLDEIGDLSLDIQVKLLRFLENGEIRPVGADQPSRANVRILCATHLPLEKLVEEGKFRRDLYYRLASLTVSIPPLRERYEDIEMLANRFAVEFGKTLSSRAHFRLKAHRWPGNVRELRHAIERAAGLSSTFTPVLGEEAFEFLLTKENMTSTPELSLNASFLTLNEMERVMILRSLKMTHGNRIQAAKLLGVARSTLFDMLKRHKIYGPKKSIPMNTLSNGQAH